MNKVSDIVTRFVSEKEKAGYSREEINKTLFIATNVVIENSLKEIEEGNSGQALEKIKAPVQEFLKNPEDDTKLQQAYSIVIDDKGKTFGDIISHNLENFLNQL